MSNISLNGNDLMALRLRLPLYGAGVADCTHADPTQTPSAGDSVSLVLGSQTFAGTVVRVSNLGDLSWDTLVVLGAGGLSTVLGTEQYVGPTLGMVLRAALDAGGETLSPTVSAELLATQLASWRRPRRTVGEELDALCVAAGEGISWRVLSDGTVWLGTEAWPVASVDDYDVMAWGAAEGCVEIGSEDPTVLPGQVWTGVGNIGTVVHSVTAERTRSQLFLVGASPGDREAGAFNAMLPPVDLYAFYVYKVLGQNADGTLELRSTDARVPDLSRCPVRFGVPGFASEVPANSVVVVGFAGGVASDPYAAAWVSGTPSTSTLTASSTLRLGNSSASLGVARQTDATSSTPADDPVFWTWIAAVGPVLAGLGVVAPVPTSLAAKITTSSSLVKSS